MAFLAAVTLAAHAQPRRQQGRDGTAVGGAASRDAMPTEDKAVKQDTRVKVVECTANQTPCADGKHPAGDKHNFVCSDGEKPACRPTKKDMQRPTGTKRPETETTPAFATFAVGPADVTTTTAAPDLTTTPEPDAHVFVLGDTELESTTKTTKRPTMAVVLATATAVVQIVKKISGEVASKGAAQDGAAGFSQKDAVTKDDNKASSNSSSTASIAAAAAAIAVVALVVAAVVMRRRGRDVVGGDVDMEAPTIPTWKSPAAYTNPEYETVASVSGTDYNENSC